MTEPPVSPQCVDSYIRIDVQDDIDNPLKSRQIQPLNPDWNGLLGAADRERELVAEIQDYENKFNVWRL